MKLAAIIIFTLSAIFFLDSCSETKPKQDSATKLKPYSQVLKAAEQGNALAQYQLGLAYALGNGTPKDYSEAIKWYRKAAEQGQADAEYELGIAYYTGNGVPKDYAQAYMWLNLGAAQGNQEQIDMRDKLEKFLSPAEVVEQQRLAHEWAEQHPSKAVQ